MKASPLGQNGFYVNKIRNALCGNKSIDMLIGDGVKWIHLSGGCVIGESQVCLQVYRSSAKANMSQIEKTPALNCTTHTTQHNVWALPCEDCCCCDLIWSGTEWYMPTNCQNGLNACGFLWCLLHIRNRASLHKYKETWRSWGEVDERRRSRVKYSSFNLSPGGFCVIKQHYGNKPDSECKHICWVALNCVWHYLQCMVRGDAFIMLL